MTSEEARIRMMTPEDARSAYGGPRLSLMGLIVFALLGAIYYTPFDHMVGVWNEVDSYYSHGFLIPPICLVFFWLKRKEFMEAPAGSNPLGFILIGGACLMLVLGTFLAFVVITQLSFVPMIFGLSLVFFGTERTRVIWFPLAFFLMMIPMPGSVTQSFTFSLKLLASEASVRMVNLIGLPMVREGSYILFKDDRLLVGDVCGGLRSLIALLSIGAIMAYISKTKTWARWFILMLSGPIAIAANVFRIFILCIVAYFQGSAFAAGRFHDVSGVIIFGVAFILFFSLEGLLRKLAPDEPEEKAA